MRVFSLRQQLLARTGIGRLGRVVLIGGFALLAAGGSGDVALAQSSAATVHTVAPGESIRSIADSFGVSTATVLAANSLDDPDVLRVGQQLTIPSVDGVLHTVTDGETLGGIANAYGVDVSDVVSANGLNASPDLVVVGTVLVIPGVKPAVKIVAPAPPAQRAATVAPAPTATPEAAPQPSPPPPQPNPPPPQPNPPSPSSAPADKVISGMVTGYAPGAGAVSSHTASGTTARWGTVAADTRLYPFGTRVKIEGLGDGVFVVEDTGSAVRGNSFDVWFPDASSARAIGTRTRRVTILAPGDD
jgi:3D (Asp-Asp-Asp) domain-containing protein